MEINVNKHIYALERIQQTQLFALEEVHVSAQTIVHVIMVTLAINAK
jgi:hypothetical protein